MIVGLGNPGSAYTFTRHNIGFLLVQAFAKVSHLAFKAESKFEGHIAHGIVEGQKVHLLLPMTYMNSSGRSVRKVVDFYKILPENMLVVSDDVDLDFLQMRLRSKGSAGGHQGLKSIQECLVTTGYPRLRIGIGDRVHGSLEDYVLGKFNSAEMARLEELGLRGIEIIRLWLKERIDIAMNLANVKPKAASQGLKSQTTPTNHLPKMGEEKNK